MSINNVLQEYDDMKEEKKILIINMFDVIRQALYFCISVIKSLKTLQQFN